MGVDSFWLAERAARVPSRSAPLRDLPLLARTVLVADFEPSPTTLRNYLGGIPALQVLPLPPEVPLPDVRYARFRTASNPIEWTPGVDEAIRAGMDTVAFLRRPEDVHGQTLLRLDRLGVRRVLLGHAGKTWASSPLWAAATRQVANWAGKLVPASWREQRERLQPGALRSILAKLPPVPRALPTQRPLRIVHFVCSLNSGGAERQAVLAAVAQKRAGHEVRVRLRLAPVGEDGHYEPLLRAEGIEPENIGARWHADFPPRCQERGLTPTLLGGLPVELREQVVDLLGELLTWQADVLHCYVDDACVVGAIAGSLAGTPAIVLGIRNGNPTYFPGLLQPWMRTGYLETIDRPGVRFVSNSAVGARDFEDWLTLPRDTIPVIANGFTPPPVPAPAEVARWRYEQGIAPDRLLIAGIFRLMPEKRPLFFLECVDQLRRQFPGLCVVMAGVGDLESQVRAEIARRGLGEVVRMLGQRNDVPVILAASAVLLLLSNWEGRPNVLIEAQHFGCVPVATDAGGSRETLLPGVTGALVAIDDRDGVVRAATEILANPTVRQRMAEAGRRFVAETFSVERLHRENMALYADLLAETQWWTD